MNIKINDNQFSIGHQAFLEWIQAKNVGIPFTSFDNPYLIKDEIAYKYKAYDEGRGILSFEKWKHWLKKVGRIQNAAKGACARSVSQNLLEHRYGAKGNSDAPLYRVKTENEIRKLENELYQFLLGGSSNPESFGKRFDNFAEYLRDQKLSCKWPFLAYLSFLLNPTLYFPVLPGRFEKLLLFYNIDFKFSGKVEWTRYALLLEIANQLKEKLSIYGQANAIQVQSYMWVVSGLLGKAKNVDPKNDVIDLDKELENRQKRSAEKERIGLLGEKFIFESERRRLLDVQRADLAEKVDHVATKTSSLGYDIFSYNVDGSPLHIEVKTTTREKPLDTGFWLSETERDCGGKDHNWVIYRVWAIDSSPYYENLGNVVNNDVGWKVDPCSWFVSPKGDSV